MKCVQVKYINLYLAAYKSVIYQLIIQLQVFKQCKPHYFYFRRNNASPDMIGREVKTLQEIETIYKNQFFKDVKKKFRRRSTRVKTNTTVRKRSQTSHLKRNSLHLPDDHLRYPSNTDYLDDIEVINYGNDYDTVDAPRIPDTVIINLQDSLNIYGYQDHIKSNYIDSETKTSSEEVRPASHVKFSDSTYDVRSDVSGNIAQPQHARATALDFELNVVVDIDSGKCTFHTGENEQPKEEEFNQFVANR